MEPSSTRTEAELEQFRQQWREEVSARNKKPTSSREAIKAQDKAAQPARQRPVQAATASTAKRKDVDYSEELEPRAYHDLPDKEDQLKLGVEGQAHDRNDAFREPESALEHYERAVERETQGNLGESMKHYRIAFKLDDAVDQAYKRKHFPDSSFVKPKLTQNDPSSVTSTAAQRSESSIPATLLQLIEDFSSLRIEPPEPPTDASPPERCALGELPEEILSQILQRLAIVDVASFARTARVCKRLAYLVMTEESIWKRVATGSEFGFGAMCYDFACGINGGPLINEPDYDPTALLYTSDSSKTLATASESVPLTTAETLLQTSYASSWRQLFRSRPRIRFGGCYISTVNYTRAGANSTNTLTWGAPVHVVTYFRYLRFFRDGSCISLLTTSEPVDVVHHLTRANLHAHHSTGSMLPNAVMKDALRGRWRLSSLKCDGHEGELFVETQGANLKYTYHLHLALTHAGKGARNNKLAWKGFWSKHRMTDDVAEFALRNDRAFYWSRVKSYGIKGE